ncbi:MAG: hypothetical protein KDA21_10220 [Phycisphaerales bacterium]|nr:hypothetical protein [Phycisphaerales bacterium]
MRFFGKNKDDGEPEDQDTGSSGEPAFTPNPAKAQQFFDRAMAVHDSTNFEYAMTLWLQGMRWDPTDLKALESFHRSALDFLPRNPRKRPTKDQLSNFSGKGPLERYLLALLSWGANPLDWKEGVKAMELAVKLELLAPGKWIGAHVLHWLTEDKKARKDAYVRMMDLFAAVEDWDRAVKVGDIATSLDPTDGKLAARVKNFAAQATINQSGYSRTGESGGFRENIRNLESQRQLDESERVVKSEETFERLIEAAKTDFEARSSDMGAITKYARLLRERGTPEDEKLAYKVLMHGFKSTNAYRFRVDAGDIKMRVARRNLRRLEKAAAESPDDPEKAERLAEARSEVLKFEIAEFEDRARNYPTDLKIKYELGRRYFDSEQFDKAIEQLQVAQDAPGISTRVQHMLGQSFLQMGWNDEAESTLRRTLEGHENAGDDMGLALRYDLMNVLAARAERDRDPDAAEEALKLASGIAIKQINYRDIRERREQVQELLRTLRDRN